MKSFKQFIATMHQPEEIAVFCNAGGRDGQYDNIDFPPDNKKEIAVFCNAGGRDGQYDNWGKVDENLNPRIETQEIDTNDRIFTDPLRDNHQLGHDNHRPENIGIPDHHGTGYVIPHNTAEHGKLARILSSNTKESDDYHDIVHKYTENSDVLNQTLHHHGINKTNPPRIIRANSDEDSEIDTDKLDRLIHTHLTPHEMVVYSGLHFSPENRGKEIFRNHSYMSTSLNPHVAKEFGKTFYYKPRHKDPEYTKHILRIIVPKHYPHLFTDNGSIFPGQSEVILPRNTKFQLGQEPTHSIFGHFNNHFNDKPHKDGEQIYKIWTGRLLPR